MRLTPALYVRQWLAKLHPPLPQTPRESQQLLSILEGSFRKHLDEVHPSPAQKQTSQLSHLDIPLVSPISSSSATHHHLNTVLNNPLLGRPNERSKGQPFLMVNAIHVLTTAFNEGTITVQLLCRCAEEYLQGLKNGEKLAEKDRLTPKVAAWVYTTSPCMREAFLASNEALGLAVRIAGMDQQESVAWDWLRMLYERKFGREKVVGEAPLNNYKWLSIEDTLVSYIMRLSFRRGDLPDAAQQFVEACKYRLASGRAAPRPEEVSPNLEYVPLEHSWKRIVASIIHYRTKHGIPEELFDRVMLYGVSWSRSPEFNVPNVMVYHPTSPSASPLVRQLQKVDSANRFLAKQAKASKQSRRAMLTMILDGAQLSLDQGLRQQARFLLDFANANYDDSLPQMQQKASSSLDARIRSAQGELKEHSPHFAWT